MKLSGQRWTIRGAQQVANLRVANKSGAWKEVLGLIKLTLRKIAVHPFQAIMMTLNLYLYLLENHWLGKTAFSLQDIKTDYFNAQWLQAIISNLDLNAESIKMHPNYPKLLRMGKMAT